jgi:hypothetical protein
VILRVGSHNLGSTSYAPEFRGFGDERSKKGAHMAFTLSHIATISSDKVTLSPPVTSVTFNSLSQRRSDNHTGDSGTPSP